MSYTLQTDSTFGFSNPVLFLTIWIKSCGEQHSKPPTHLHSSHSKLLNSGNWYLVFVGDVKIRLGVFSFIHQLLVSWTVTHRKQEKLKEDNRWFQCLLGSHQGSARRNQSCPNTNPLLALRHGVYGYRLPLQTGPEDLLISGGVEACGGHVCRWCSSRKENTR